MSYSFELYDNGENKQNFDVIPGAEHYISELLFTMVSGKFPKMLLDFIKLKLADKFEEIEAGFTGLLVKHMKNEQAIAQSKQPAVKATEVFGNLRGN
jgi:hypothetical protein